MNTIPVSIYSFSRAALLTIAAVVGTLVLSACGDKTGTEAAKPESKVESPEEKGLKLSAEEQQRAGIKLEAAGARLHEDSVTVTATIRANQDRIAQIAPRVEGRIVRVTVNLGDNVKAGQALAVLDSVAIGEAQSSLLQAQSAQRTAQADFSRAQSLAAEEIIAQRDFLRARGELDKASAELRAAQDKLRLLGGTASSSRAESTFALTAPFNGAVIQKKATVGELASPNAPVFTVADLSKVWVEANLSEDMLAKVKQGAAAVVTTGAYPGERFAGRVTYLAQVLEKDSRTVGARIEVPNPAGKLKPEMFANATIETGGQRQLMTVPDESILLLQGQPTVFVSQNGVFEARPVETEGKASGRTVIKSGLKAGDQVVAAGAYALKARLLKSQIGDAH
ncbi:efflux RND transporter periplasmic adaptor subunit [Caenimonas koreensis DSM 17982]|uniref:Efflux RND transporter periplasmic adaptor subunit n=1 Tax=Caenimonas koreensis DSM 17982 TaxID=1121255 RepID=A0A844B7X5_9BURK|nr:efflux RND transporter periplasmic adaptor subunit [Caenimonas koreensis]MRD47526.1 efflux RND transporter periplasmic adaptor subunit [Caenimonas koreensis DSM 17982]